MKILGSNPYTINHVQLLDLLIKKIYALCYWKEWMKKEGSSLALQKLMDILPIEFFQKYELAIIKALIYALNTLPEFITVTAHINCSATLKKIVTTCHPKPHFECIQPGVIKAGLYLTEKMKVAGMEMKRDPAQLERDFFIQFKNICKSFIQQLNSEHKFARRICKQCINQLQECESLPLDELLRIDTAIFICSGAKPPSTIDKEARNNSEVDKMTEALISKSWSANFLVYNYPSITAGIDCLDFLIEKDLNGNIMGTLKDMGSKLIKLNRELIKIIKNEINCQEELKKASDCSTCTNYYMLQEKKHIYFHPVYEDSAGTIYAHPIKTEKERLEEARSLSSSPQENKKIKDPAKGDIMKSTIDKLNTYAVKVLSSIPQSSRQTLLKGDYYIYKVFPRSEARIKAVCVCVKMLCNQYAKFNSDIKWVQALHLNKEEEAHYQKQLSRFSIFLFRLLLREEKCIHKYAKNALKTLFDSKVNSKGNVLPDEILTKCIHATIHSKISDLNEYKKMMHIIKLFPKSFPISFWQKNS